MSDRRIASLDFLRGLAALSVTIPHFFMYEHLSERLAETISILGVEVFFVLSGYVLAPQIIFFVVERPNVRNLGVFWVRRWMRTIPAYLIALLLISTVTHELGTADFFRYLFYVQNFARQSNTNDYFLVAWSLSVEEWFYLLFPVFFIGLAAVVPLLSMRAAVVGAAFILLISLCRSLFGDDAQWGAEVRRVVIYRVDAIAWGFLLNLAVTRANLTVGIASRNAWSILALVGSLAIILTLQLAGGPNALIEAAFPLYAAAFGASAIIVALAYRELFAESPRLSAVAEYLGHTSYSTYLFHVIVLSALAPLERLGWPLLLLIYLTLTAAVATVMYIAVEAPILALRPRFSAGTMFGGALD
jgi:peptidoglycan/LPS O-acetylase OafA/YrhL